MSFLDNAVQHQRVREAQVGIASYAIPPIPPALHCKGVLH
jgi:hypothetical protein